MSKYTTELRYIIEGGFDLGLKDYPIFSEEYRKQLNHKILNHYYFHEIGFETAQRFKFYLNTRMNEIMVYYNQLLKSELIKINPLLNFEKVVTSNTNKTEEEKGTNNNIENKVGVSNTSKTSENDIVKDATNDTTQEINNLTSLDNKTESSTQEGENVSSSSKMEDVFNSYKDIDGNNSSDNQEVFYDTPQGSLGDITESEYATSVTKKDENNNINETENLNSSTNQNKQDDVTKNLDSTTENTTKTDTSSNTSNSTKIINNEIVNNDTSETQDSQMNENLTSSGETSKNSSSEEVNVVTENGYNIPLADLIIRYRDTFLNVDLMIIKELKDLFMMIY